jgi:hypothetical protein
LLGLNHSSAPVGTVLSTVPTGAELCGVVGHAAERG